MVLEVCVCVRTCVLLDYYATSCDVSVLVVALSFFALSLSNMDLSTLSQIHSHIAY